MPESPKDAKIVAKKIISAENGSPHADQPASPADPVVAVLSPQPEGEAAPIPGLPASIDSCAVSEAENATQDTESGDTPDFNRMKARLMALQQEIRAQKIPVIITFEGWSAAGKGSMLGELLEGLDPRGYKVHVCGEPSCGELRYPPSRRYWMRMPAQGNISLFVGSWYYDVSNACLTHKAARRQLEERYQQIVQMESQLIAGGALLIKFFLNIPKKEQKKRLKALEAKKSTEWRVTAADWEQNARYDDMMQLYDAMMSHTHFDGALWHVLRGEDKRACKKQMYDIVLDAFEKAILERKEGKRLWDTPTLLRVNSIPTDTIPSLSAIRARQTVDADYKQSIDLAQKRLRKLHSELYRRKIPLILCFEGWDAAGKGGSIRRLTSALDPRGFEVIPICAPTPEEKSHHHLWRFWRSVPQTGHIAIFDRSWYGRVMVERIEGFCSENEWRRAYEELNQFEYELMSHGAVIRKFWLQIDSKEQLRRFKERQSDPEKQWKITDEDWRNRKKWSAYKTAVNEMLRHTHTTHAPWIIVEANDKRYARLKILHAVIDAIEQALKAQR